MKIKIIVALTLWLILAFAMWRESQFVHASGWENWWVEVCEEKEVQDWVTDYSDEIEELESELKKLREKHDKPKYKTVEYCKDVCNFDYDSYVKEERNCTGQYVNPFSWVKYDVCLPPKEVYDIMKDEVDCNYWRMTSLIAICWQESSYLESNMNWTHSDWTSMWVCWVNYWSTSIEKNIEQAMQALNNKKWWCKANGNYAYSSLQECSYQGYNWQVSPWYRWYWEKIMWIFNYLVETF